MGNWFCISWKPQTPQGCSDSSNSPRKHRGQSHSREQRVKAPQRPGGEGGKGEASLQVYFGSCFILGLLMDGPGAAMATAAWAQHGVQPSPGSHPGLFGENHPKTIQVVLGEPGEAAQTGLLSQPVRGHSYSSTQSWGCPAWRGDDVQNQSESSREGIQHFQGEFARVKPSAKISPSPAKRRKITGL